MTGEGGELELGKMKLAKEMGRLIILVDARCARLPSDLWDWALITYLGWWAPTDLIIARLQVLWLDPAPRRRVTSRSIRDKPVRGHRAVVATPIN